MQKDWFRIDIKLLGLQVVLNDEKKKKLLKVYKSLENIP
jgi:hypothetical protein